MTLPARRAPVSVTGIISEVSVKKFLILFHHSRKIAKAFLISINTATKPDFLFAVQTILLYRQTNQVIFILSYGENRAMCSIRSSNSFQMNNVCGCLIGGKNFKINSQTVSNVFRLPFLIMKIKQCQSDVFFSSLQGRKIMLCYQDRMFVQRSQVLQIQRSLKLRQVPQTG